MTRPLTLLIAALGGEGGGVLTNWIVGAARRARLPVQSTSIPGVAQRTGATTYYIEIWPEPSPAENGRRPVMSLSPAPGEVDIVAATELLEAGRCILSGFVSPDRTSLIASTHRVYTTHEKMAMGDGRFDPETLHKAAKERSKSLLLFDMHTLAREAGAVTNAVMLGVIAGSGRLPIPPEVFEAGIEAEGKMVEANLRGFRAGLEAARNSNVVVFDAPAPRTAARRGSNAVFERARAEFPVAVQDVLAEALARLIGYQDAAYAELYLDRLLPLREMDPDLLTAVARHLAVRMSYEDIIRVAALKTRAGRFVRIRADLEAGDDEPVRVVDFFKPRLAEVCDILPPGPAGWLRGRAEARPRLGRWQRALRIDTTSIAGFLSVWVLARLRPLRRRSSRFAAETAAIEGWLADIGKATARDTALAREICECAGLFKGYGDTHRRGAETYARIRETLIHPALDGGDPAASAAAISRARAAALADPAGRALSAELAAAQG